MPSRDAFDLRRLDVAAFAADDAARDGVDPVRAFARLAESTVASGDREVAWRIDGRLAPLAGAGRVPCLHVRATASVGLQCQRCLEPVETPVDVDRRLFFVDGEDAAAALDAESEDDVLAIEPTVDARALLEDELLLALPLVPRHEVCPAPLVAPPAGDDAAIHPFAGLAALKTDGRR